MKHEGQEYTGDSGDFEEGYCSNDTGSISVHFNKFSKPSLAKATAFSIGTVRILISLQNTWTNLISEISSLHHYKTYQTGNIKLAYKLLLLTMLTEFLQNYLSVSPN